LDQHPQTLIFFFLFLLSALQETLLRLVIVFTSSTSLQRS
jgi:hypothetical protein